MKDTPALMLTVTTEQVNPKRQRFLVTRLRLVFIAVFLLTVSFAVDVHAATVTVPLNIGAAAADGRLIAKLPVPDGWKQVRASAFAPVLQRSLNGCVYQVRLNAHRDPDQPAALWKQMTLLLLTTAGRQPDQPFAYQARGKTQSANGFLASTPGFLAAPAMTVDALVFNVPSGFAPTPVATPVLTVAAAGTTRSAAASRIGCQAQAIGWRQQLQASFKQLQVRLVKDRSYLQLQSSATMIAAAQQLVNQQQKLTVKQAVRQLKSKLGRRKVAVVKAPSAAKKVWLSAAKVRRLKAGRVYLVQFKKKPTAWAVIVRPRGRGHSSYLVWRRAGMLKAETVPWT